MNSVEVVERLYEVAAERKRVFVGGERHRTLMVPGHAGMLRSVTIYRMSVNRDE